MMKTKKFSNKNQFCFQLTTQINKSEKYFVYHDKQYPFDFSLFKKNSNYFYRNRDALKNVECINLLNEYEEKIIDISENAIHAFISSCQNEQCKIDRSDIIFLQYLSNKFDVPQLTEIINNIISSNFEELFFQSFLFKIQFDYKNDNDNEENWKISFFNTEKEEEILVKRFIDFVKDDRLLILPIPVLERITQKYYQQFGDQNSPQIIDFLFKCLDKFGRDASILFSNFDFEDQTAQVVDKLISNYSDKFDFNMINSNLLKTINLLTSEISKLKEESSNTISKMKEVFETKRKELEKLIQEMKCLKEKGKNNLKEIENEMSEKEKQLDDKMSKIEKELNARLCAKENQLDARMSEREKELDEKINEFENKIVKNDIEKDFSDVKEKQKYQIIKAEIVDVLYQNNLLKSYINDLVNNYNNYIIEIAFPSNTYRSIFSIISDIKKKYPKSSSNLRVSININSFDDNDEAFIENKIINICVYSSKINNICLSLFGCTSLTQVIIPSSVKEICDFAFERCSSLAEIFIPNSVTSIGNNAFHGCSTLTQITIPDSIKVISNFLFASCFLLEQIKIPSSVTDIGVCAFKECLSLKEIVLPSSIKYIREFSFSKCYSLKKLEIPSNAIFIGKGAFSECQSLSIKIPSYLNEIQSDIYHKSPNFEEEVTSIFITGIPSSFYGKDLADIFLQMHQVKLSRILPLNYKSSAEIGFIMFNSPISFQRILSQLNVSNKYNLNIFQTIDQYV